MIHQLLEFSLRQRLLVLLAALALVATGVWAALRLPIDAVPDVTNAQVQVNTEVPALAPEEIEKLVTYPIEIELAGVPGADEMRSISKFGLSQVTVVFKDGTDIYRARQLVGERLQAALEKLPAGLQPKLAPITTGLGEIYYYTLDYRKDAKKKPGTRTEQLMELRSLHEYLVKPQLRTLPGVADVNSSGGFERQIVVQPDPQRLSQAGLTFAELAEAVAQNTENAGGGVVNIASEQVLVRAAGRVTTTEEVAGLPVKFRSGVAPLLVRDVADVAVGTKTRTGSATENGEETVIGTAMMLLGENSRTMARAVAERLKEIATKLPEGVEIRPVYDRADVVDSTIATVKRNLFEGAVLVIVILLAMLGNWRAAIIVAAAIPLSLLFAITGMVFGGISGNLMSLGAVDFGLIIDGAVVMVENIVRRLGERQHQLGGRKLTPEEHRETVLDASRQVASPMFFGVLIITLVYIPILALTGISGKMFHPMALTVMLALGGALVLALTLMPVLCSFLLKGRIKEGDNLIMRVAKRLYGPALNWALRFRWVVALAAVALFAGAVFVFGRLGAEFIPKLDEGSLTAMAFKTTSISMDASTDVERRTEKMILARVPEVTRVFSRLGTSDIASDPMGPNANDIYIFYKPRDQWRLVDGKPMTKEGLVEVITKEIDMNVPGQELAWAQPIEMRFNELLEGIRADISVKIFGTDYAVLEKLLAQTQGILENTPGAVDVQSDALGRVPMLEITPKRDALVRLNVPAAEINRAVGGALAGKETGVLIEGDRRVPLIVRMPERLRQDVDQMRMLPIRTRDGGLITLGQVAEIKLVSQINVISRDSGQRQVAIMLNLRGRDVEGFVNEAQAKVREQVKLPDGYSIEFGGQFKNLQEARTRLAVVVPAALALIFVLVFFAFNSVRQVLLIYTGIPLAVTGGVFALALRGLPFSISAAVGFIALSGVAVLNGMVMIHYFNELREKEGRSVDEAVREGALTRLRPVLMTALVASLGFVPMALAHGPGAEVQRPLATVVIGGILSSTALTLLLLPVLYAWVEGRGARREKAKAPALPDVPARPAVRPEPAVAGV